MWVCLNNAFFSIVKPSALDANPDTHLMVRARRPGDIERVFPDAVVVELDGRDYQFRAYIERSVVGVALMCIAETIDYGNFKNSVKDDRLHDAYGRFWHEHAKLQPRRPYSRQSLPSYKPEPGKGQRRVMPQFGHRVPSEQ
jgi:hypothetical protein